MLAPPPGFLMFQYALCANFTSTRVPRYIVAMQHSTPEACPCGSNIPYTDCCEQYIGTATPAPTAEKLMRSRYSAYTQKESQYLLHSWHTTTRPTALDFSQEPQPNWLGLKICRTEAGSENDTSGIVEFIARYKTDTAPEVIHEVSRFVKEGGHWFYVDGTLSQPTQNAPCPCGSGKKYKRCCGK